DAARGSARVTQRKVIANQRREQYFIPGDELRQAPRMRGGECDAVRGTVVEVQERIATADRGEFALPCGVLVRVGDEERDGAREVHGEIRRWGRSFAGFRSGGEGALVPRLLCVGGRWFRLSLIATVGTVLPSPIYAPHSAPVCVDAENSRHVRGVSP